MSVVTRNGVTTIKPTSWKWLAGAGAFAAIALASGDGGGVPFVAALFLAVVATGGFFSITLDKEGFSYRSAWKLNRYRWADISGFKVKTVRYGFFPVLKQVVFTEAKSAGTIQGKLAKLVSGGTNTVPVYGMDADDLVRLMYLYQDGRLPPETPATQAKRTEAPKRAKPREQRVQPTRPAKPVAVSQTTARPPSIVKGQLAAGQDPLIQDSAARRRATRMSPLG